MTDILKPPDPQLYADPQRPSMHAKRPAAFQDVRPVREAQRPVAPQRVAPVVPRRFTAPKTKETIRRKRLLLLERIALIAAAPVVVIVSARLSMYPIIGESIIAVYAAGALVRRIPSRISFWLASMALVSIGVEMLLLPGASRPNNTALFVFLLLAVGLASSMLEAHRLERHSKHLRRR